MGIRFLCEGSLGSVCHFDCWRLRSSEFAIPCFPLVSIPVSCTLRARVTMRVPHCPVSLLLTGKKVFLITHNFRSAENWDE